MVVVSWQVDIGSEFSLSVSSLRSTQLGGDVTMFQKARETNELGSGDHLLISDLRHSFDELDKNF